MVRWNHDEPGLAGNVFEFAQMIAELSAYPELPEWKSFSVRKAYREVYKWLRGNERERGIAMTDEAKMFLALATFDGEVSNGGLAQYFTNLSGADYSQVREGLRSLAMTKQLDILERWLLLLPEHIDPKDARAVGEYLFSSETRFQKSKELDMEYYRHKDEFLAELVRWAME